MFGAATAAQALSFTLVVESVPKRLTATAMAFNNMCVVLGAMVIQMLGGYILQHVWSGAKDASNHAFYSIANYQDALSLTVIFFATSLIVAIFFIKEKNCKFQHAEDREEEGAPVRAH